MIDIKRAIDVAWAAGLFEGEGCFSIVRVGTTGMSFTASLYSTDRDVVERFGEVVGVGTVREKTKGPAWLDHHKTQWRWQAGADDAVTVARLLMPHLGTRRSKRGLELIEARERLVDLVTHERVCPGCGVSFRPRMSPGARGQVSCTIPCGARWAERERRRKIREAKAAA